MRYVYLCLGRETGGDGVDGERLFVGAVDHFGSLAVSVRDAEVRGLGDVDGLT